MIFGLLTVTAVKQSNINDFFSDNLITLSKFKMMSLKIAYFILSENDVHIGQSEGDSFTWLEKYSFSNKTDYYYKEQLQLLIEKHQLNAPSFEEHIVMWYSPVSSLVPMNMLNDLVPKELLKYSFSENKIKHDVNFNRISELSIVHVFEIPTWLKSFFVLRFPRAIIQHFGTGIIRGIFNTSSFKPTIHLFLTTEFSLMLFVKHNELVFYNSFEYTNENDLVYYALHVLTQNKALSDAGNMVVHPLSSTEIDEKQIVEKWNDIREASQFKISTEPTQTLKFLATCV
jgi:hypothetical protein